MGACLGSTGHGRIQSMGNPRRQWGKARHHGDFDPISKRSHENCFKDRELEGIAVAIQRAEKRCDFEAQQGQVRQLCRNGVWLVPASERPKGWEKMGLAEPA